MLLEQFRHKVEGIHPDELKYANIAISIEMNDKLAIAKYKELESSKFKVLIEKKEKPIPFASKYLIIS